MMIRVRTVIPSFSVRVFQRSRSILHHQRMMSAAARRSSAAEHATSNSSKPLSLFSQSFTMPAKRKQKKRHHGSSGFTSSGSSFLADFFAKYPQFDHDATNSASREFYRLCDELEWDRDNPEKEEAHESFKDALVQQFNQVYGKDESDLENWQALCHITHIDPVPDGLKACREAIRGIYVNLVDLVDTDVTGQKVRIFKTELQLSQYTRDTGKFFPRDNAYAGGLLRYLLRHILCPATQPPPSRSRKRKRH